MQPNTFSRISWSVIIIATLCLGVYILEKAASAVPFPSAEIASTTEQVASYKLQVTSTENGESTASTSKVSGSHANQSAISDSNASQSAVSYSKISIKAPLGIINVIVASTSEQQSLGLGQRDALPANEGMLFPFAVPGQYGFWMKDMRFSLDMVWISADKRVVMVSRDVSPASYPEVLYPPNPISYVLELNRDSAVRFGIATSTKLVF